MKMNLITTLITVLAVTFMAPAMNASGDIEVKTLPEVFKDLPICDRVELSLLGSMVPKGQPPIASDFPIRPYNTSAKILEATTLSGEQARQVCLAWRNITFDNMEQALCHFPIYGLRFFNKDDLVFETSVCFKCSNFYYESYSNKFSWHGFRTNDDSGKQFRELLNSILPMKKSVPDG